MTVIGLDCLSDLSEKMRCGAVAVCCLNMLIAIF